MARLTRRRIEVAQVERFVEAIPVIAKSKENLAHTRRLRRALVRYHRRRMQIAPELIERLYSERMQNLPT